MSAHDKLVSLVIDEMSIKTALGYDQGHEIIEGIAMYREKRVSKSCACIYDKRVCS